MPPLVIKAVVAIFWDRASNRYTWAAQFRTTKDIVGILRPPPIRIYKFHGRAVAAARRAIRQISPGIVVEV
jgi:hypothetical protein